MVDFTLNFFLSYDEAGQTIVRLLLHSFHSVKLACALPIVDETLNEVNFGVGTRAQATYPLEVRSLYIEVAEGERP